MSSTRIHARNLLANWGGHLASLTVLFFLSPFVVHTLGKVEFGIWSLLTVVTGYMGVLDLGIRASTGRHVILYLGRGDADAVDGTIRTSLGFFSVLGAIVLVAGAVLGLAFPQVFRSVPAEYHTIVRLLLPLLALGVWISALQAVFTSVLIAHERFDLARAVDLAVLAVRTAATVGVLMAGWGLLGLAAVAIGSSLVAMFASYVLARRLYPALRVWPLRLDRARTGELVGYGLAAFVSTVSVKIIGQTDLVVAGAAIGVAAAGVYSVGASVANYSNTFLNHINSTLFPAIQKAIARNEWGSTRWLMFRATRLRVAIGVLFYVGMICFAEPFIRLWMFGPEFGEESVRQAALVLQVLAAARMPLLFVGASVSVLNAIGRVRLTAVLTAIEATANLALSLVFVLVLGWGLVGIAAGTLAARLLVGTLPAPWFACKETGANWPRYLLHIGGSEILVAALFAAMCLAVRQIVPIGSWTMFFGQVALVTAGYAALAFWLLVPAADRRRVWNRMPFGQVIVDTRP